MVNLSQKLLKVWLLGECDKKLGLSNNKLVAVADFCRQRSKELLMIFIRKKKRINNHSKNTEKNKVSIIRST